MANSIDFSVSTSPMDVSQPKDKDVAPNLNNRLTLKAQKRIPSLGNNSSIEENKARKIQAATPINFIDGIQSLLISALTNKASKEKITSLLAQGVDVNSVDENRIPALHHALIAARYDILQLLLTHKANTVLTDRRGYTALGVAVMSGDINALSILLLNKSFCNLEEIVKKVAIHTNNKPN